MADGDSKDSCPSSPRPMAFTVDFGSTDGDQDHKKLALRDSIGRFAPAKIKSKLNAPGSSPVPPSSSLAPVAAAAAVIVKDNTNHQMIKDEIILDEENNIKTSLEEQTAVSDAGTYTIDDEEEDPKDDEEERDKDIHRTFGLPNEKVNSREWVSVWASNSFAEDNPIQEEEDPERSSSSQRRRLPPTPLRQQNGYQQHKVF